MLSTAVEMGKSGEPSEFAALFKGYGRVRVGFGGIAIHIANSQGANQFSAAQHEDMPVKVAASLVPGANGVTRPPPFSIASPGVLHSEMLLALSFEIVGHIQILCMHPTQEYVVVFLGARQMHVIISRYPFILPAGRHGVHLQRDRLALVRRQGEVGYRGGVEETMVGFEPVLVPGGHVEGRAAFEQNHVGHTANGNLQSFGQTAHAPDSVAVEVILHQRKQVVNGAQAMRFAASEQVNSSRDRFARVTPPDNHFQMCREVRAQSGIADLRVDENSFQNQQGPSQ